MTGQPFVTVGLPFFNNEPTLALAVRSIFAQTLQNWRLILMDDGSTDGSLSLVKSIRDPRVTVLSDGLNVGLPARLNQLAGLSKTSFLARMDGDDIMHPERLSTQVRCLLENPGVDAIGSAAYVLDSHDRLVGLRGVTPPELSPAAVLRCGLFVHPTVMGRTQWFRDHPYDENFAVVQDLELWVRTASSATFLHMAEPLLFYREPERGTAAKYVRGYEAVSKVVRRYGPELLGRREMQRQLATTLLKQWLYRVSAYTGSQPLLMRRRNHSISPQERARGDRSLDIIARTEVPGLPVTDLRRIERWV